jgi:hypothetical protein
MKRTAALVTVALAGTVALSACSSSHRAATQNGHTVVLNVSRGQNDSSQPKNRVILLGRSIGGISLREPRSTVEKVFGPGKSRSRGVVSYFGGRLLVDYWFHDGLTTEVQYLKTTWGGFHTRSGVHMGTSRKDLRLPGMSCMSGICGRPEENFADAPGTSFGMRDGKVAWIAVGFS